MPRWPKSKLFTLLGDRAYVFSAWCVQGNKDAKAVSFFINNSDDIDFNGSAWQDEIIPILLKHKVIDQAFVDRLNNYIGN